MMIKIGTKVFALCEYDEQNGFAPMEGIVTEITKHDEYFVEGPDGVGYYSIDELAIHDEEL